MTPEPRAPRNSGWGAVLGQNVTSQPIAMGLKENFQGKYKLRAVGEGDARIHTGGGCSAQGPNWGCGAGGERKTRRPEPACVSDRV